MDVSEKQGVKKMELENRKVLGTRDETWTICKRKTDGVKTEFYLHSKKKDGFISSLFPVCRTKDYAMFLFDMNDFGVKVWRRLVITPEYEAIEEIFEPFGAVPTSTNIEKAKLKLQEASELLSQVGV